MEHDQWSVWIADSGGYKGSCVIEKTATGYRVGLGKDTIPDWSDLEGDDIIKMKNIEQTTSRGFTTSSGVSASSDVHRLYSFDSYTTPYYSTYYRAIVSPLTNYFIAEDVDGTTLAPSPTNQIMSQDLLCLCHKNKKLPVPLSEEEARTCGTALISLL